jgi:hypothetical protein
MQVEDGWVDAMGCVRPYYPTFTVFIILGPRGIVVIFIVLYPDLNSLFMFPVLVFPQPIAFPVLCRSSSLFHIPFCWVQIGSLESACLAVNFCLSLRWVFSPRRSSFPYRFSFWRCCSALDFLADDWFRVS